MKFNIGDQVIATSKDPNFSKFDGEYVIEAVLAPNETVLSNRISVVVVNTTEYRYDVGIRFVSNGNVCICLFHESELKRKYKPATQSFSQLMQSLNINNLVL